MIKHYTGCFIKYIYFLDSLRTDCLKYQRINYPFFVICAYYIFSNDSWNSRLYFLVNYDLWNITLNLLNLTLSFSKDLAELFRQKLVCVWSYLQTMYIMYILFAKVYAKFYDLSHVNVGFPWVHQLDPTLVTPHSNYFRFLYISNSQPYTLHET